MTQFTSTQLSKGYFITLVSLIVAENSSLPCYQVYGVGWEGGLHLSLKPLRASTLLNAKTEQVQLLMVVEMCALLSSPSLAGREEGKGVR